MLSRMERAALSAEAPAEDAPGEEAKAAMRIAAAAPGLDRLAEAELYRRMAPRVRRYGMRHLRDTHAANDLMQLVMVRVIEHLREGKVREPQRIVSFVFGTCRMVLLEQRRGESRRERLLEQWGDALPLADIAPAPRLDHVRVADCLERLAERERSVIVLTFCEDRAADDVASMLGTTAGNVRVIRHRGMARLRDCVGGGGLQ
jgi:RNA polymerase sigma-70 factor (ECF subfamily)